MSNNNEIRQLEPQAIWENFANLNAVPRASKKEEQVIDFMVGFGKKLNLPTTLDKVGNVIIKKPATQGMENRKTVILQAHLDMVHQKNNDTDFDFATQGIAMYIDGDWVKAKGTTLGADNGLGVATIMAILENEDMAHPALEALFTIDEETGMTGAMGLEAENLSGEILLNLDTEDDDEIGIGCAGGIDITATKSYEAVQPPKSSTAYKISIKGLQGGHSGMDIHRGFGNANKMMNRVLFALQDEIEIGSIDGGGLRNAIPRESNAVIVIYDVSRFLKKFEEITNEISTEYKTLEKSLQFSADPTAMPKTVLSATDKTALLRTLYGTHNGVFRMSPDIENLVETSNNLAKVEINDCKINILCLTRSSVESGKQDLVNTISSVFELGGFTVETGGSYPGWKPDPESSILKVLSGTYEKLFEEKPNVLACHAGLECGILGKHKPEMDMISFGPTIKGAHSPDERASITSTRKFWIFTKEVLKNIPEK